MMSNETSATASLDYRDVTETDCREGEEKEFMPTKNEGRGNNRPRAGKKSRQSKNRSNKNRDGGQGNAVISVMLIVPSAQGALDWYKKALGAKELWNLGGVAGLEVGGAPFFIHEANPQKPAEKGPTQAKVTSTRIELFVDNPDVFINRALAAGASLGSPIEEHDRPWGKHRQGGFKDPFGHNWSVGDKSPLSPNPV
jgi:PhnB protein